MPGQGGRQSLAARRRRGRRRVLAAFGIFLLLASLVIITGLRQSAVRISRIETADPSTESIVRAALDGYYAGIIPRDSAFFFSASRVRARVMAARPDIAAVSISRSLTSLSVTISERVPIARWCGLSPLAEEQCYIFDANGYLYAPYATTTQTVQDFTVYAPLEGSPALPLRATVLLAEKLPGTFDFARRLGTLGSPVTYIHIRDDEVDDMLASGTRVTYLFGQEQNAYTELVSASPNVNLADGSFEYVDLRFNGKVYLKRR